jgi:ubiquinol-cytochrome c reductase cytochrome b subunit
MVGVHLLFLHQKGSSNPLGVNRNFDKLLFHPYFSLKDLLGVFIFLFFYMYLRIVKP